MLETLYEDVSIQQLLACLSACTRLPLLVFKIDTKEIHGETAKCLDCESVGTVISLLYHIETVSSQSHVVKSGVSSSVSRRTLQSQFHSLYSEGPVGSLSLSSTV